MAQAVEQERARLGGVSAQHRAGVPLIPGPFSETPADSRLLGMLQEGGQVVDTKSFEGDMGMLLDDEEAKEVEEGEFVKVSPVVRRPPAKASTAKSVAASPVKRPAPTPAVEDTAEKRMKKAKKAKA